MNLAKKDIKIIVNGLDLLTKQKTRMQNTTQNEGIRDLLQQEINDITRIIAECQNLNLPLDEKPKK